MPLKRCSGSGMEKRRLLLGISPSSRSRLKASARFGSSKKNPAEDEYPAESAVDLIPQADVVALTGSALVKHTLDNLLALCRPDSHVIVLVPRTPLLPLLFKHCTTIILGIKIIDEAAVLLTVGQGASFRQVSGVKLLTLWKSSLNPSA